MEKEMTIVMGVIGADCHAVGNKILERFFRDSGFKVVNLGVMVSQDEYIDAAIETGAEAILVSSLYGHGEIDCQGFRERCTERGLENIVLYVGGNLVVGKTQSTSANVSVVLEHIFARTGSFTLTTPNMNGLSVSGVTWSIKSHDSTTGRVKTPSRL